MSARMRVGEVARQLRIRRSAAQAAPRRPGAAHQASTVSVHVRHLGQLFSSFDPSPFWDRDLDRDAAAFVEEEFADRPRDRTWVLNVTTSDLYEETQPVVQDAVKHYYLRLADSTRYRIREQLRIGRISLAIGVGVFVLCMSAPALIKAAFERPLPDVLSEGLIVLGWIALWLPIEQLVGDLIPLIRQRSFYQQLARIRVHLRRVPAAATVGAVAPSAA
jgi:hypothetical protein